MKNCRAAQREQIWSHANSTGICCRRGHLGTNVHQNKTFSDTEIEDILAMAVLTVSSTVQGNNLITPHRGVVQKFMKCALVICALNIQCSFLLLIVNT